MCSRFITTGQQFEKDSYIRFRRHFIWDGIGQAVLNISAETTFAAFVNGTRLQAGQLADIKGEGTISELQIEDLLHKGNNVIAVEIHYAGMDFSTIAAAEPYFMCEIFADGKVLSCAEADWRWDISHEYTTGLCHKVTSQLGFVFEYDARKADNWISPDYNDDSWNNAIFTDSGPKLSMRKIPQLREVKLTEGEFCQMGYLVRQKDYESFAETAFNDFMAPRREKDFFLKLPEKYFKHGYLRSKIAMDGSFEFEINPCPEKTDGTYVIVDMQRETCGYVFLDLDAPEGTVIDICYGEHLEDGRVRSYVGLRNFADRYICREGANIYMHPHRRISGRYLELHFTNCSSGLKLRNAGIIPLELPLPQESTFTCDDKLLLHINSKSAYTLKLCMHEHYEDTPWREQSMYAYDSRNQILYGYSLWGNYDFAENCLDLMGANFDGDGYLYITSPGGHSGRRIPIFTMVWIPALREHWLYSGKDDLFRKWHERVDIILDRALDTPDEKFNGLYHPGKSKNYWNFCEWNNGLQFSEGNGQAPYNIYLLEAIITAAEMHENMGNTARSKYLKDKAKDLAETIERLFWDPAGKGYAHSMEEKDEFYGHVQAIMLANGLVPPEKKKDLVKLFKDGPLSPCELPVMHYLIKGLVSCGAEARSILADELRSSIEPMALESSSTLWETKYGASDFEAAGSLCHGWASIMPFFCRSVILGITPVEPGFRTFKVSPYTAGLPEASGEMPTPYGNIYVHWDRRQDGIYLEIKHPAETKPIVTPLEECPIIETNCRIFV